MAGAELSLRFDSEAALRREYESNLRHGRAFIAGAGGVERLASCTLTLQRSDTGGVVKLPALVVLVSEAEPMVGVAVQMTDGPWREQLEQFVEWGGTIDSGAAQSEIVEPGPVDTDEVHGAASDESEAAVDDEDPEDRRSGGFTAPSHRHLQIRGMSLAERSRIAHGSSLEDRIVLERVFGSSVWEMLLRSGTVTPPEVATIARKGSLPIPLLELIADNANWVRQDVVRRALLTNARLPQTCITKILNSCSKNELKLMAATQGAYSAKVRSALAALKGKRY